MKLTTYVRGEECITPIQIAVFDNIPEGDFSLKGNKPFLVKNITGDDLEITCIPYGMDKEITTTLGVGWNVEIMKEVKNIKAKTLQYGY